MNPRWLLIGITAAAVLRPAVAQQAPSDTLLTVDHYFDLETAGDPQISPDGKTVVYTRSWVDKVNDRWDSDLWIMNADGSKNRFLLKGSSPRWSPDGTRLAYLGAAEEPKGAQIFVRWMDAEGATSQVTRVTEAPGNLSWSPDGKWIAFTMFVPKSEDWAIDMPAAPPNAKWTGAPRYVNRLHYRADRQGFTRTGFHHVFVVPTDGGSPRQLTRGDWNVGIAFDAMWLAATIEWLPDGKTILIDGLQDPNGDTAYRESYIYSVDLATGAMKRLTQERGFWGGPTISPDGTKIAYFGNPYSKQPWRTSDLMVMNLDGSGVRNLSREVDRDPFGFGGRSLYWAPDGSGIYWNPSDRGVQNLVFTALAGGATRPVTTGNHMFSLSSLSKAGTFVGTLTSFQKPADVVSLTQTARGAATFAQLTSVNDDLLAGKRLAAAEEIWYTSTGGARIQGWIVKPTSFDPKKKYPMLLEIHGGPQGMYSVGFDYMWQTWAASGFVVLYTNPRGSTGYGSAFVNAIDRAYPGPDYDDLMAGVDTVLNRGYVDPTQLYVSGCSGGGKLSSWVIGHTNRFAAAAVRCPVTNWIGMTGGSDVPLFAHSFFEKPFWEDPAPWLERSSLMYVGKVTTPTVLMTGELDRRTPMSQTEEYFAALKMRGVPSALLRFEGEWHGTESIPSNWIRTQLYMMSWFKKYTRPTS